MKTYLSLVAACVLSAPAFAQNEQSPPPLIPGSPIPLGEPERALPWGSRTNLLPAGWSQVKRRKSLNQIATNTPAFNEYTLNLMLTEANRLREKFGLPIAGPLTTNNTCWYFFPSLAGPEGSIETTDGRYTWSFLQQRICGFDDKDYWSVNLTYSDKKKDELAAQTSKITETEAVKIAQDALHALGLQEKTLGLKARPGVVQCRTQDANGKIVPLPLFKVLWVAKKDPDDQGSQIEIQVSGVTKTIVDYDGGMWWREPKFPLPTNYFEMLGVKPPTNDLQRKGRTMLELLPPATNATGAK